MEGSDSVPKLIALCGVLFAVPIAVGQTQPHDVAVLPVVSTLSFEKPQTVSFGTKPVMMTANYFCSEDGVAFLAVADSLESPILTLHAVKSSQGNTRFAPPGLRGFGDMSTPLRYFAADGEVAMLVIAEHEQVPGQSAAVETSPIVLIYDRKAVFKRYVPVPEGLDVRALGLFESGDLLLAALDEKTHATRLVIVDSTGRVLKELSLFDEDFNGQKNHDELQPASSVTGSDGALATLDILPYGQNLLIFPRVTRHAVIELNEHGVVRSTSLQLPPGATLATVLSATRNSWKIRTYSKSEMRTDEQTGSQYAVLKGGATLEFNPLDGTVRREIDMPQGSKAKLVCEHDGDYLAIQTDAATGALQILQGKEDR